jgi:glutaredoxin
MSYEKTFESLDELGQLKEIRSYLLREVNGLKGDNARMLTHATNVTNLHNAAAALSDKKIGKLTEENQLLKSGRNEAVDCRDVQLVKNAQLVAENERLRNRIAKLQSLGIVDVEALTTDLMEMAKERDRAKGREALIEELTKGRDRATYLERERESFAKRCENLADEIAELTKHNHALSERAKRAEGSFTAPYVTINGFHYYLGESK